MDSGLKQCVDTGLVPSTIFNSLHNHTTLEDPTEVGVTQFVLNYASDFSPSRVKQVANLFESYGYHDLASSMTGEDMSIFNYSVLSYVCMLM